MKNVYIKLYNSHVFRKPFIGCLIYDDVYIFGMVKIVEIILRRYFCKCGVSSSFISSHEYNRIPVKNTQPRHTSTGLFYRK